MSIRVENLSHTYNPGTPFERCAIDDVTFEINDGEFVAIVGETGSGKSTLIQHFNGLLKPTKGRIFVDEVDIWGKGVGLKSIRQKVGLVFQYPEHQLFEETVFKDIAFGPRNIGIPDDEVESRVQEAMKMVGLDYKELRYRSPFELSGGEKRRVAMAGVIAMKPSVIVLDEPASGLDPRGRDTILAEIRELHEKFGFTVVLVSHSMEDVAKLARRVVVLHKARLIADGPTKDVFSNEDILRRAGLEVPQVTRLMHELKRRNMDVRTDILTVEEAKHEIIRVLKGGDSGVS